MQKPEEDKSLQKLTKDELLERVQEQEAQNQALLAEKAAAEARAKKGAELMDDADAGELPEYELEYVQFHKNYSHGGVPTGNRRVWAHKPFSCDGGEVVLMPKKLARLIATDRGEQMNVGKDALKDQVKGTFEFDPKSGQRKPVEKTVKVDDLIKNARTVGLAKGR